MNRTKQVVLSILCIMFCVGAYAGMKGNAVEMVTFEQEWLDDESSLSLKNNTTETIHNVTFLITYLDMKGRELDYREYAKEIIIKPGKTKKLDIPAYERDRHYQYYKNKEAYADFPTFKVKFELKDYNTKNIQAGKKVVLDDYDGLLDDDFSSSGLSSSSFDTLFPLVLVIIVLGAYIGLYFLVVHMARTRGRDAAVWLFLAIIASPLLVIIILLIAGDSPSKRMEQFL